MEMHEEQVGGGDGSCREGPSRQHDGTASRRAAGKRHGPTRRQRSGGLRQRRIREQRGLPRAPDRFQAGRREREPLRPLPDCRRRCVISSTSAGSWICSRSPPRARKPSRPQARARGMPPRAARHRPPNILYGVEDRPPLAVNVLSGLQHVGLMSVFLMYPALLAQAAGAPSGRRVVAGQHDDDRAGDRRAAAGVPDGAGRLGLSVPADLERGLLRALDAGGEAGRP